MREFIYTFISSKILKGNEVDDVYERLGNFSNGAITISVARA